MLYMRILFDFEITYKELYFSDIELKRIETARNFIYERVKILEDEINKQPEGVIVINALGTLDHLNRHNYVPIGMHYRMFEKELTDKLEECVTLQDWNYLISLVSGVK